MHNWILVNIKQNYINIKFEKKKDRRRPHSHRAGKPRARWHAAERVAARRRAVEAAGGGEDEGARARGVEAGAAKPRWHGAGAGMADVNGGGARRDDGARWRWARAAGLWAATSTAAVLGDVELARWGGAGERTAAAPKETSVWGKGEGGRKEIYGGAFCPGWSHHPGQKVLLSRVDLPPGTKGARFPLFPPNVMFVFVSFYFSFKIGFHLLIQLIKLWYQKLWNKISYLYINLIHATKNN